MRVVFYSPQFGFHLGTNLYSFITRTYGYRKYSYFFDYAYSKQGNIPVVIEDKIRLFSFIPARIEILLWAVVNKKNPLKIKALKPENLKKDDVFFCFSYPDVLAGGIELSKLRDKDIIKIMHITHFSIQTSKIAKNYKKFGFTNMVGESNLRKNSRYFRKYFNFYKKNVYPLPFVFQDRFKKSKSFKKRINKCLATGTYEDLRTATARNEYNELINFFKINSLHPMREIIYERNKELKELIDSYIGKRYDKLPKTRKAEDNFINKFLKSLHNVVFAKQKKYFSFDIVQKYNDYKMFVVPEEASGLPSIGFVEGMACGAAYIGKKDPMYEDLGLVAGKHYIGYDGTLPDLKAKIKYYQKHQNELEKIAENGYRFVTENFNGERVARVFWSDLRKLVKGKNKNYKSSFVKAS